MAETSLQVAKAQIAAAVANGTLTHKSLLALLQQHPDNEWDELLDARFLPIHDNKRANDLENGGDVGEFVTISSSELPSRLDVIDSEW